MKKGRDIRWQTTVGEQRDHNIHVQNSLTADDFAKTRKAGELSATDATGKRFRKVPLNLL